MLNVSIMPTIRPGSHGLMRVEPDLGTLATSKPTNWGVSWAIKGYKDLLEWVFTGLKKGKS